MDQLRVPTRRIEVQVFLVDGTRVTGTMFHHDALYDHGGPADICDELNDERAFLPFDSSTECGGAMLLSKRHILRVLVPDFSFEQFASDQHEQHEDGSTLLLDDGTRVSGRLILETRLASSRLLDKLNQAPAFVPFVTDHGVELINRGRVVRVFKKD